MDKYKVFAERWYYDFPIDARRIELAAQLKEHFIPRGQAARIEADGNVVRFQIVGKDLHKEMCAFTSTHAADTFARWLSDAVRHFGYTAEPFQATVDVTPAEWGYIEFTLPGARYLFTSTTGMVLATTEKPEMVNGYWKFGDHTCAIPGLNERFKNCKYGDEPIENPRYTEEV